MCGRFTITRPLIEYINLFGLVPTSFEFPPQYNAHPLQKLPVISSQKPKEIEFYQWGLVPHCV
ncbi:SOS response-associated peptidase [bacterium]|nr:SOS response-associated peptidase [bacterium]